LTTAARGGVPRSHKGPLPLDLACDVLPFWALALHTVRGPAGSITGRHLTPMKITISSLAAVGLLVSLAPVASSAPLAPVAPTINGAELVSTGSGLDALAFQAGWVVKRGDNLCGLRDPKQLSNPAKVNYKRCLAATPEMKKMESEGIRPGSPEGIQLKNAAATRVSTAANTVRKAGGFCSVWKAIKHNDGRDVSDITARIVGQY